MVACVEDEYMHHVRPGRDQHGTGSQVLSFEHGSLPSRENRKIEGSRLATEVLGVKNRAENGTRITLYIASTKHHSSQAKMLPRFTVLWAIGLTIIDMVAGSHLATPTKPDDAFVPRFSPFIHEHPPTRVVVRDELDTRQNPTVPPVWGNPREPPPQRPPRLEPNAEVDAVSKRQERLSSISRAGHNHPSGTEGSPAKRSFGLQKRRCLTLQPIPPDCDEVTKGEDSNGHLH
ncbi:hypothetical protein CIHG_07417 [Coccidioides immitis H538.4]|nr:hypothetical protein CIRG_02438 [Coccidioides immitis RMSCC 2394]KMU89611.1 hypothetical protein CIHG_07417 [Coccidioides immitis H538.4]